MRALLTLGLLGAALAAPAGPALAAGPDGAFVIRNPNPIPIQYQVRWGGGEWESFTVSPGCERSHAFPLDGAGRAPAPEVRFDCVGGDRDVTFRTYALDFYAVHDPFRGRPYVFRYAPNGRALDLYRD